MYQQSLHVFKEDKIDFCAIISINHHGRGPSLGGCRLLEYASIEDALDDAKRLSSAMSYKAAISNLPYDGGKAVIMKTKKINNHPALLKKFADCINTLEGKYITTVDSGTHQEDMIMLKKYTSFVTGFLDTPSDSTAWGVFKGIQAATKLRYNHTDLSGLHVAIQGVGNVGYRLAQLLYQSGSRLTVCDLNSQLAARCANDFDATIVSPDIIYDVPCDIFSPCALGRGINAKTLPRLKAKIIAGAANDQLESSEYLHPDILYIPDFLINAGGLIHLALQMQGATKTDINIEVSRIYDRIIMLDAHAKERQVSLEKMARMSAEAILYGKSATTLNNNT
ncbi:MAG: Glu/Leu/Phe/Val dehydrogenase dimerization domain-containing protein [Gammaproteobacteria bacterium]